MIKHALSRIFLAAIVQVCLSALSTAAGNYTEWVTQFGTASYDIGYDVDSDKLGNIYLSGYTAGEFDSLPSPHGGGDAFISKHDRCGNLIWAVHHGTDRYDQSNSIAVTQSGSLYIAGYTVGDLAGIHQGGADAFLSKYDTNGNLQWNQQFGSTLRDENNAVTVDSQGNAYVAGTTGDIFSEHSEAFIRKYDEGGALLWMDQFGQPGISAHSGSSRATSISTDGLGSIYVSGTFGDTNATAYLRKYDNDGELLWSKTLETTQYNAHINVSADPQGNVFVAGGIGGSLLIKFDGNGSKQWTAYAPDSHSKSSRDISADGFGNVYVTGIIFDSVNGYSNLYDIFTSKYGPDGVLLWTQRLSTRMHEVGYGIGIDSLGNAIVTGYTEGGLIAPNRGHSDFFLAKFADHVPEPSTLHTVLASVAAISLNRWHPRRSRATATRSAAKRRRSELRV
jgi:hypothetical protein